MPAKLSLGYGKELHHLLAEMAEQSGRHLVEQTVFLLEVMLSVIERQPDFPLQAGNELNSDVAHHQGKIPCRPSLISKLGELSRSYGVSRQQLIRILLFSGIKHLEGHHKLAQKEVLIEYILGHYNVAI
ncbi:MAG: hypothetical protein WC794_00315 [Candidatus Doudnabacteria bacterium]|jgi:hypothetical protein